MEATFNQKQVKAVGPTMPFLGPLGVAGGMFRGTSVDSGSEEDKDKHYNFLLYGLVLMSLGIFGGDSFLTGYNVSGYVRILLLISIIGAPLALLWFGYNIYQYLIRQDLLFDGLYEYFGAPKPVGASYCPNILEVTTVWLVDTFSVILSYIPVLNWFAPYFKDLANRLYEAYGLVVQTAEAAMEATEYVQQVPATLEKPMSGGGVQDAVGATLLGATLLSIIVSAVLLTFWRRNQKNAATESAAKGDKRDSEKSDDPPDAGDAGEIDKV